MARWADRGWNGNGMERGKDDFFSGVLNFIIPKLDSWVLRWRRKVTSVFMVGGETVRMRAVWIDFGDWM